MIFTTLALVVVGIVSSLNAEQKPTTTNYPTTTVITEVDLNNDIVTCATFTGIEYQFEGCEEWCEGDICSMIMNDNGTTEITDDKIIKTRYCGFVSEWGIDHISREPLYNFKN